MFFPLRAPRLCGYAKLQENHVHTIENASMAVEVCKTAFERAGCRAAVRQLRGLELVNPQAVITALATVRNLSPVDIDTHAAKNLAVRALECALVCRHVA